MNPQKYIISELEKLKSDFSQVENLDKSALKAEIFRLITSKKFRKYSLTPEYKKHIESAIGVCVDRDEPIKLTVSFGGYKLWRLDSFPEVDWAELFALVYYTKWLEPICKIYKPGVWFDFFSDDVIISRMNNIDESDIQAYGKSFRQLINFMKSFLPDNLEFTFNSLIDKYENRETFESDLREQIEKIKSELNGGLPCLDEKTKKRIDLNVKVTAEQLCDPFWREKITLIHDAYMQVYEKRPYYITPDKILVSTTPTKIGSLAVGTTKHSIAKFWCGEGALKQVDGGFCQTILSPSQIEDSSLEETGIKIDGLQGKNFQRIPIITKAP